MMFLFLTSLFVGAHSVSFTVHTSTSGPGNPVLIPEYLSVTIDAGLANHFNELGVNNTLVNTLAKGIVPLFFRYGGTTGDKITYNITQPITATTTTATTDEERETAPDTLTSSMLSNLADFVIRNEWKWIFGINAQKRKNITSSNPTGVFDTKNAQSLISAFLQSDNPDIANIFYAFELGNEPDLYPNNDPIFYNITAQQLAQDFYILYNLINNLYNTKYNTITNKHSVSTPKIFGCDIAYQFYYLRPFLNECSIIAAEKTDNKGYIDGITWHSYYGNSADYTLADFVKVSVLDELIKALNESISTGHDSNSYPIFDNTPIMLGETSSTYGGGSANLSASYAAGFLWLDKLGLSSIYGLYSVMRQDFWGGNYALIGISRDHEPNPDYWSSLLFKTLIGQFGQSKTLSVDNEFDKGRDIRVYAFCTNIASNETRKKEMERIKQDKIANIGYNYTTYDAGSITLLVLNLQNNTIEFDINLDSQIEDTANAYYDEYILTSYPGVLNSRDMYLNGKYIQMVDNSTFPSLLGVQKDYGSTIEMPALSYGFVVVSGAQASVCM